MGELEQRALGIFVQAPEVYVSLWAQSGETGLTEQQFQDLIDMGEEGRTQLLQQNQEFSKGIVEFYKNNQEVVDKALEQTTSKMFNGGKLAYGLEKFKCGGKTKKYQTPSGELPKRPDGIRGEAYTKTLEDGSQKKTLTRRNNDGTVDYTTQTITPQNDTTYTTWRNANDRETRHFVTPYTYRNLPWYKKLFTNEAPNFWKSKFDMFENGGKTKKYQKPSELLPEGKTEIYPSSNNEYIQLRTRPGMIEPDSTFVRLNEKFTPIESVSRFYDLDGTPITYNNDWNFTSEGASNKFDGLKSLFNKAKNLARVRKIQ